jgi:hypothetical protein
MTTATVARKCMQCNGSGVLARLNNANCIACNGTGRFDPERDRQFQARQMYKARVQKLSNSREFDPEQWAEAIKQNPALLDEVKMWDALMEQVQAGRMNRSAAIDRAMSIVYKVQQARKAAKKASQPAPPAPASTEQPAA